MIKKMESLDLRRTVSDSLQVISPQLVEAQKEQMLHGQSATGGRIGKYKDPRYAKKKFSLNNLAGFGFVDLKFKGVFQRNIKTYFFSTSFFFRSTDPKANRVLDRYGGEERVMGLNKQNSKKVSAKDLVPEALKRIKKQIL